MSTTPRFTSIRSFPFCVTDISGSVSVHASFVDNLTLTEAMAFAWNLETLTITTTGSVTSGALTANGNAYLTLTPLASDKFAYAANNDGGMWFGDAFGETAIGSFPAIRTPRERICGATSSLAGTLLDLGFANLAAPASSDYSGFLMFWVGVDPSNAGRYRIYYRLEFNYSDTTTQTIQLVFSNKSSLGSFTAVTSGTHSIGGITFNWYAYKTSGTSDSGVGLSATSGDFTYV